MTIPIHPVFKEFLKSLNSSGVEYLVIGGYAVSYHGYPRPTGNFDVWVRLSKFNAAKLVQAFRSFGFDVPDLKDDLFLAEENIVRMGVPPTRIEVITSISGVEFDDCYPKRVLGDFEGVPAPVIGLEDLLANKKASGRHKDLADVDELG
ncbi:hypothetical protein HYR69_03895 [Candidatus Sumerlaeota bacterium]|nr:hypothetical protein [Candidatus Sumerlaeota bacterium]